MNRHTARYQDDALAFGVTVDLYSSVLNLLVQELTSGSRMLGLTHSELMTVASTLSKAGEQELSETAWTAVMRETSRMLAEDSEESDRKNASLTHAMVVVLNCLLELIHRFEIATSFFDGFALKHGHV